MRDKTYGEYHRRYYWEHVEERREYSREYYYKNREKKLEYERKRRQERRERGEAMLREVLERKV